MNLEENHSIRALNILNHYKVHKNRHRFLGNFNSLIKQQAYHSSRQKHCLTQPPTQNRTCKLYAHNLESTQFKKGQHFAMYMFSTTNARHVMTVWHSVCKAVIHCITISLKMHKCPATALIV